MSVSALLTRTRTFPSTFWSFIRRHLRASIVLVVLVGAVLVFLPKDKNGDEVAEEVQSVPSVSTASVATLRDSYEPLTIIGEVRSVRQVELRSQKSGEVTRVAATPDTYVAAGTILAEIDPASERAGVVSAEGALSGALAQLAKVRAGDRSEDKFSIMAQAESAAIGLATAQESARAAYTQSYALAADAVYAQADDYFTNVYTVRPGFRITSASYDEKRALEYERVELGTLLEAWDTRTQTPLENDALDQALGSVEQTLDRVAVFINTISKYISEQKVSEGFLTASEKAIQEAQMAGARASAASARSVVSGSRQSLAQAQSAAITTSFAESKTVTGARPEDIAAAEAGVMQARGALASAQASLERALIRTPIGGTVSSFNVSIGDFVSAFESIAIVVNPGALELEVFVTSDALTRVEVGMPVRIAGSYEGVVTSRAPGLDPTTKKARVTVSAPEDANLVNGSFVEITIERGSSVSTLPKDETMVPITAIKVLPRGFALFTVENNTLVSVPIDEGPIVGSMMLVRTELAPDLQIVTDVRGLSEGDTVTVTD